MKAKLQQRARQHGRSTEEEVREILRNAVRDAPHTREPLGKRLRDSPAAEIAATIAARQRQAGRSAEIRNVLIAGITAARKAALATRNTRHFADLGIALIDPWQA